MDERFTKLIGNAADRSSTGIRSSLTMVVALVVSQACSTLSPDTEKRTDGNVKSSEASVQVSGSAPRVGSVVAVPEAIVVSEPDVQVVKVPLLEAPQGKKMSEGAPVLVSTPTDATPPSLAAKAPPVAVPSQVPAPIVSISPPAPSTIVASKDPHTFVVAVGHKDKTHIGFGIGHDLGFIVNGVQGRDLVFVRGTEYTFEVRTDPKHDFYLSTKPQGGGGSAFTEGVTGQFTYNGDVVFTPAQKSPDMLYYQCRNHQNMGGRIAIVNSVAEVKAAEEQLAKDRAVAMGVTDKAVVAKSENITEFKAQQKIAYADMLLKIKVGGLTEDRKKTATDRIAAAKQAKDKGEFVRAYGFAGEAVDILSGKQPQVSGPSEEEVAEQEKAYSERLLGLQALQKAHADAHKRAQKGGKKGAAVDYDHKEVDKLLAEAQSLAKNRRYRDATNVLGKGELGVATALNGMLSSQTLVYELTFDTPKDEYEYELARFKSYDELIPVAVDVKKPSEQAMSLMQGYVNKSHFFRDKAAESAASGRFDEAIAIMRDATSEVRHGLMALGVSM